MSNRGRHRKKPSKYSNTWLTNIITEKQLDLLFARAYGQNKTPSLRDIERHPTSTDIIIWDHTPEGWGFWNNILSKVNEFKYQNRL